MISVKNLDFQYSKRAMIYNQLNLELEVGKIVGLLGKNGTGKSTLFKLMSGLLQPKSGSITISETDPFRREPSFLSKLFFVPEEFDMPPIRVRDFVKNTAVFYPRFDYSLMNELLKEFSLQDGQNLKGMSYGQKKKVIIAFALATKAELILMDEPTNGLDIPSKNIFRKIMAGHFEEDQLIMISTHQVKDIDTIIDHLVVLDEGGVIYNESIFDLTQKYNFLTISNENAVDAIYSEAVLGGYKAIVSKQDHEETQVDLELFFNALISDYKQFF
ncbi:ABC transporter ATP-binding protein [Sediminitomix flava]|uniref:ABC-2 type transport system ATP-binding protein n=1 Tax=Sediminitomix flava TaxID=379075 RepID=A0A315Z9U3_SEDFL|nr:ABC transporter ATP-binding protein [Sediminitomix flava]PWJ41959.1 ABC-2 type transport system ATP-binding protein [Sediminitomix flava]